MPDGLLSASNVQVIALLAALVAIAVALAAWDWLVTSRLLRFRIRALTKMYHELHRAQDEPVFHSMRTQLFMFAERMVERFDLMREEGVDQFREKLAQAGWRGNNALRIYVFLKFVVLVAAIACAILFLYVFPVFEVSGLTKLAAALGTLMVGVYVPNLVLSNIISRRQDKITKAIPEGLDLMLVCAEAGLSFGAALDYIASETHQTLPEFADEFTQTSIELRFLPERRLALQNLAQRVPTPEMRSFINTLIQTERHGTPLSEALRTMSEEMRTKRILKAEEKAARLPAVLTIPMLIFILPALFIVVIGPAALNLSDVFKNM